MCKRRYCRPPELPLVTGFLELAVARSVDLGLSPDEHIVRRHIADGAMQAYGVVVLHVGLHQAQRTFTRQRRAGSDALRQYPIVPRLPSLPVKRQIAFMATILKLQTHTSQTATYRPTR